DMGAMQIGAVNVPVYPNISMEDYRHIFSQAQVRILFVGDKTLYQRLQGLQSQVTSLEKIYSLTKTDGIPHWSELLSARDSVPQQVVDEIKDSIKDTELATLIYTSGTTGIPKGVMLSHRNIVSNIISAAQTIPVKEGHRALSSLPLCHIFERMVSYLFMYKGTGIYYAERMDTIADNLKEVKPHFFTTVPRLLEKVFEKIMGKGEALTGMKKKLFFWSVALGLKYEIDKPLSLGYRAQLAIANAIVFKKWRAALGGDVISIISGAAALQPRLARIFTAAGIPVKEGYGQTEASPVIAVNRYEKGGTRFGSVGKPLDNVEVKIAPDGEILAKGPNVMMGYYQMPDLTAETIDSDGWLHTGDVGEQDADGFLKITDRKKELFKTSGGKYVAPQPIENTFKESFLVDQVMVVGENKKTISALIVPAMPGLEEWCRQNGLTFGSREEMLRSPLVVKKYAQIRDEVNKNFGEVEKVKRFVLMEKEWTIDTGELTPTLKLKRKIIYDKYSDIIGELYGDEKD
nr:long-chain fatty acid--CoA ligase [Bacteroidota bacterium]